MQRKMWLFIIMIVGITSQMLYGQYQEFVYDDSVRAYAVYEPSLDPNPEGYPLVIGLHGAGSEGYAFIGTAFLIQKATREKFIAACPNALRYPYLSWWNAGDGYEAITNETDDLGFISALIDTMIVNYNVDTTRIYAMGFSNGSMMAYRVAAELSHKIAAMGVVSGQMVYEYCNPEFPVPIIHLHGLEDDKCPYEGKGDSTIVVPPVDTVMTIWREFNNCASTADTIFNENGIIGRQWPSPDGKSDIIMYTIEGWGHSWPRTVDPGIDATDVIWDFLKKQKRSNITKIQTSSTYSLPQNFSLSQNYPNPFNPSTKIKYKLSKSSQVSLKIYNLTGQEITTLVNEFQKAAEYEVTWRPEGLPSGLYFLKIQAGEFSETRKLIFQK